MLILSVISMLCIVNIASSCLFAGPVEADAVLSPGRDAKKRLCMAAARKRQVKEIMCRINSTNASLAPSTCLFLCTLLLPPVKHGESPARLGYSPGKPPRASIHGNPQYNRYFPRTPRPTLTTAVPPRLNSGTSPSNEVLSAWSLFGKVVASS